MKKSQTHINVQDHILPDGSMSPQLRKFLQDAADKMKSNAVNYQTPPWIAFPEYERYSLGWRMGPGEDYWHAFQSWMHALRKSDADAFIAAHPEPENWAGFYDAFSASE